MAAQPNSTVPLVGASGAIAGVTGAYPVLCRCAHQVADLPRLIGHVRVTAKWLPGICVVSQFFIKPNDGVAWIGHVGGFVFGILWRPRHQGHGRARGAQPPA